MRPVPSKKVFMRAGNKGLTVKLNLWPPKWRTDTKANEARQFIKGQVTRADNRETKMFNGAGQLLTILGDWNVAKFKELKAKSVKR